MFSKAISCSLERAHILSQLPSSPLPYLLTVSCSSDLCFARPLTYWVFHLSSLRATHFLTLCYFSSSTKLMTKRIDLKCVHWGLGQLALLLFSEAPLWVLSGIAVYFQLQLRSYTNPLLKKNFPLFPFSYLAIKSELIILSPVQ